MYKLSERLLEHAEQLFEDGSSCDTIIRDILSDGIARVVWVAFDTRAVALHLKEGEWDAYRRDQTYLWFENKGYVDWYCRAASEMFVRVEYPKRKYKVKQVKPRKKEKTK